MCSEKAATGLGARHRCRRTDRGRARQAAVCLEATRSSTMALITRRIVSGCTLRCDWPMPGYLSWRLKLPSRTSRTSGSWPRSAMARTGRRAGRRRCRDCCRRCRRSCAAICACPAYAEFEIVVAAIFDDGGRPDLLPKPAGHRFGSGPLCFTAPPSVSQVRFRAVELGVAAAPSLVRDAQRLGVVVEAAIRPCHRGVAALRRHDRTAWRDRGQRHRLAEVRRAAARHGARDLRHSSEWVGASGSEVAP